MIAPLIVELPTPPSANDYWRSVALPGCAKRTAKNPAGWGARVLVSTEAREYKQRVELDFRRQHGLYVPVTGPIALLHIVWRRARRAGDASNRIKVVEDALKGLAYKDDSQIERVLIERVDGQDPGCTVTLWPAAGAENVQGALLSLFQAVRA